jgi:hypothetical protein
MLPICATAYSMRGADSMLAVRLPLIEKIAPSVSTAAPAGPIRTRATSASGVLLAATSGATETVTTWISR